MTIWVHCYLQPFGLTVGHHCLITALVGTPPAGVSWATRHREAAMPQSRTDKVFIIWPDKRYVSLAQIKVWYSDAVANGDMGAKYLDLLDPWKMAEGLSDAGIITLGQSI